MTRRLLLSLPIVASVIAACLLTTACSTSDTPGPAPEGMVWVPGGEFWMGSTEFPDALPVHRARVDGFWMDAHEVTNEKFAAFVEATGYKTVAERDPDPEDFPGVEKHKLVPFAGVFKPPLKCPPGGCKGCDEWWKATPGACWKHPTGPRSSIKGREKYPVVQVAWDDAVAYAKWAGKRLPTEAEWEYAARGGLDRKRFYWGDELKPDGKWMANIWQGGFPCDNTEEDGFRDAAPVGSFPPNAFGLYDMAGNVWEWCSDWYRPHFEVKPGEVRDNPTGPTSSVDTHGRHEPKRVQRGGSYLCSDEYCIRYLAGGRMQGEPKTGLQHTGFRCVKSVGGKQR